MDIGPHAHAVRYRWQGFTLGCWRRSLEMLMEWRHGSKYGKPVVENKGPKRAAYGSVRTEHTRQVRSTYCGRNLLDLEDDYGLFRVHRLESCDDLSTWQAALREYGPILAQGIYGPAHHLPRQFGHAILITGWSRQGKLAYYDPFLGVVPRLRQRPGEAQRDHHSYYTLRQVQNLRSRHGRRYNTGSFLQARAPWVPGPPE